MTSASSEPRAPTLACMVLYKDERQHLERIAEKILEVFDQAIFVTNEEGSSDGSETFLQSLGIEPVRMRWQESFAKGRQVGLDASVCDYTLWMDCDDDLITDQGGWGAARVALRSHLARSEHTVHWHRVYHADRRTFWVRENWFHTDAGVKVKYPTHEVYQWQGSIGVMPPGLLDRVNAPLRPDYAGKHWRYFNMLHKYLRDEDPHDCRCRYYLAAEFDGPPRARVALYEDFFDALAARPTYRNFPEEWCALYALFELRAQVPTQRLLELSRQQLIRWPFELLAHVLHALITCELQPSTDNALRFMRIVDDRAAYAQAGSGWFRGWYFDKALNACGYYLHKAAVLFDNKALAAHAVRVLEEASAQLQLPEMAGLVSGNLAMARRWSYGLGGASLPVEAAEILK